MSGSFTPDDIDAVIHERVRLGIVSALAVVVKMSFNELKESLSLTDGNLSAHIRTLEDAGYVKVDKTYRSRRPLTLLKLTRKGRIAFNRYLDMLQKVIDGGRSGKWRK